MSNYDSHSDFIEATLHTILTKSPDYDGAKLLLLECYFKKHSFADGLAIVKELIPSASPELLEELKTHCLSIWELVKDHQSLLCFCIASILFKQEKYLDALNYCDQVNEDFFELSLLKIQLLQEQNNLSECFNTLKNH